MAFLAVKIYLEDCLRDSQVQVLAFIIAAELSLHSYNSIKWRATSGCTWDSAQPRGPPACTWALAGSFGVLDVQGWTSLGVMAKLETSRFSLSTSVSYLPLLIFLSLCMRTPRLSLPPGKHTAVIFLLSQQENWGTVSLIVEGYIESFSLSPMDQEQKIVP